MKFSISSVIAWAALACAQKSAGDWQRPADGEVRGPCPGLNTLANHGFLPRDGKNITRDVAVKAMVEALNYSPELSALLWSFGLPVNPEPNATFWNLEQLRTHNILEHDSSMSRHDAFYGDKWWEFNKTVFDTTRRFWPDETLTLANMVNGKLARRVESKAFNPTYFFTDRIQKGSFLEDTAPVLTFGSVETLTVNRSYVEYMFEEERLPSSLGWVKNSRPLTVADLQKVLGEAEKLASLLTAPPATVAKPTQDTVGPLLERVTAANVGLVYNRYLRGVFNWISYAG